MPTLDTMKYDLRVRLRYLRFRLWWIPFRRPDNPPIILGGTAYFHFCGNILAGTVVGSYTVHGRKERIRLVTLDFDAPCLWYVDDEGNRLDEPVEGTKHFRQDMQASHLLWGYQK